jgi:NADH-quinone oxidoreductase subunit N
MVRLLAWSSVAQAGYLLAPLAVREAGNESVVATLAYTFFYVVLELCAFAAVIALRGPEDGGRIADYAGAARQRPWAAGVLALALIGLAGLPPGLAGLFAKVVVVRALLGADTGWLAIVVALNAVLGLAYYLRATAVLFAPAPPARGRPVPWPVAVALTGAALVALVIGFAPQVVLAAAGR